MNFHKRIDELENGYNQIIEEENNNAIKGIVYLIIFALLGLFLSFIFSNILILIGGFLLGISTFSYRLSKIYQNFNKKKVIAKEKGIAMDMVKDNVKDNYLAMRVNNLSVEELRTLKNIIANYDLVDVANMLIDKDMVDILLYNNEDMIMDIINKDVYEIDDSKIDLEIPSKFISEKKRVRKLERN